MASALPILSTLGKQRRAVLRTIAGASLCTQLEGNSAPPRSRLLADLWSPSELSTAEERSPVLHTLVTQHVPALALCNPNIWPVDVSYSWHDGSPVYTEEQSGKRREVLSHKSINAAQAHFPPPANPRVRHYIDCPGTGPGNESEPSGWSEAWRRVAGTDPLRSAYPPTQYVHAFWINRARGLLGLQYWFFYPFNEWVNCHAGDWEHVVVVLSGRKPVWEAESFSVVSVLFHFHEWVHEAKQLLHLSGATPAHRHPVIFVGGQGDMWNLWRCQHHQSGGSYPWPGRYRSAGTDHGWLLSPNEQVVAPQRFLDPDSFRLVMLPEPHRVTPDANRHLWWLRWNLYFGQKQVSNNLRLLRVLGLDHPPQHPGQHRDWNMRRQRATWPGREPDTPLPVLPSAWVRRLILPAQSSRLARSVA